MVHYVMRILENIVLSALVIVHDLAIAAAMFWAAKESLYVNALIIAAYFAYVMVTRKPLFGGDHND